ncbi:MAG: hypothetical protein KAQ84_02065 [Thermoplasmatales archaeon]|nr:hypothetical protein [Thermoplasmatales archaeon]MCK5261248.1 hypothetical protein [Thermoplasmatales archaeon]
MNKVDIKIVGLISDEEELDEIQSIAKIFVYEQRMKGFKHPAKKDNSIRKNYLKYYKKTDSHRKTDYNHLPHLMVRGLI